MNCFQSIKGIRGEIKIQFPEKLYTVLSSLEYQVNDGKNPQLFNEKSAKIFVLFSTASVRCEPVAGHDPLPLNPLRARLRVQGSPEPGHI